MERVATFHKVSEARFCADAAGLLGEEAAKAAYAALALPRRATAGSAGYDFFAPLTFTLQAGESITLPSGIRAEMADGWVLCLYPRSGLGFKFCLQLDNTVGIIDADYFYAENEGHILIKMTNHGDRPLTVEQGKGFAQGLFLPFGITTDDNATAKRTGGFGSTTR